MGDHDTRFATSPNVGASSAPENNYIIDGLSVDRPALRHLGHEPDHELRAGGPGDDRRLPRRVWPLDGRRLQRRDEVRRQRFHGDVFTYYRNKDWSPDQVVRRRNKETTTFFNGDSKLDFGASLGGPIVQDKLWFFAAADPTRRTSYIGGSVDRRPGRSEHPARSTTRDANIFAGKLTFTPQHQPHAGADRVRRPDHPAGLAGRLAERRARPGAARAAHRQPQRCLQYNGILSPKWLIEASIGRHHQRNELEPDSDTGRTVPRQVDETIGQYEHGGFQRIAGRPVRPRRVPAEVHQLLRRPTSSATASTSRRTSTTPTCTSCGTATSASAARAAATTSRAATTSSRARAPRPTPRCSRRTGGRSRRA